MAGDWNEIRLVDQYGYSHRFRKPVGALTYASLKETTVKRPPELVDEREKLAKERHRQVGKIAS